MGQKVKKILFNIALVYFSLVAALYIIQRNMIFHPSANAPDISAFKADAMEELTAIDKDGIRTVSWYRPPVLNKETIVFFHGNASSHLGNAYKAKPYLDKGYGFLSVGYPGYGGNHGKPTEASLYRSARTWLNELTSALEVNPAEIILYGESVGTGIAVQMALEFPSVKAVILESPYTSLPDVAAKRYFFVPVRLLMKDKFDSLSKVLNISAPLLILQGSNDKVINPKLGQKLYAAANDPKEIIKFQEHGHNDMPINKMAVEVEKFLKNLTSSQE